MPAMVAVPIADTVQMQRLTESPPTCSSSPIDRPVLQLRELIDRLHADLIRLTEEE